ncbi:MAG TPA: hypothetical protein VII94_05415 [Candidatus Saccharimonadales bacterium]
MELGDHNPLNPNTLLRITAIAGAIADVIHDRVVSSLGIFNLVGGFDLTLQQEKIWNNGPTTFADAMERRQAS